MIAGIDEAGKGPVLGPMCIAGLLVDEEKLDALGMLVVRDSKKLTAKKRESIAELIKESTEKYYILEVRAAEIDELRKVMTMNEIMVECYVEVLEKLKPSRAFVDAADVNPVRFGDNLKKKYSGSIEITSEHRADEKYPVVAAASILAKVRRDELVKELGKKAGVSIGSGYPSDPKTIRFLVKWVAEHGKLPDFARSSWETSKRILGKSGKGQRKLD